MMDTKGTQRASAEVDFLKLFFSLWAQKKLIISIALLAVLIGGTYAFLINAVYEAKAFLRPPTYNDMAEFNYGRTNETELKPFTVKEVYDVFSRTLLSASLHQEFFEKIYLPSLNELQSKKPKEDLYADYLKAVAIVAPTKDTPDRYSVVAKSVDPAQAAEWAEGYAVSAGGSAKKEMIRNVTREAEVRARSLEQQISTLQESGEKTVKDSIARFREALRIAEAIGLENPPIISGETPAEVSANMGGQLVYMQGSKALKAQIKNLQDRKFNDPFVEQLRELQIRQNFYKRMIVSPGRVSVYQQDGEVELPDKSVQPQKTLILILSLLVGGGIGVVVAITRYFNARYPRLERQGVGN
ncbi:Wzz/FepE/Etk N-terminal domain-containing protein [Pseudomonas sp. NA-150]|uniref:Wzz/FepE/Etk N-terminal domain-containing protein n=1 Tax=Pseudomonas sp. NA-150 TaxID=3367525 RepID=UPI0037C7DF1B